MTRKKTGIVEYTVQMDNYRKISTGVDLNKKT